MSDGKTGVKLDIQDMVKAFVWKESIYKNNFTCGKCGERLAEMDGTPLGHILYHEESETLWCPKCKDIVCKIKKVDLPVAMHGKCGQWSDFSDEPLFDDVDCGWN